MDKILLIMFAFVLTACGAYKIVPQEELVVPKELVEEIEVSSGHEPPGGIHCFEPMMYILTVGIIPTHCVESYLVKAGDQEIGEVKLTVMRGWVALLIAPLPTWRYGLGEYPEQEIINMVRVKE